MNYKPVAEQITIAAAGTRQRVSATDLFVRSIVVQGDPSLAADEFIFVGGDNVSATAGIALGANVSIAVENPGDPTAYINLRDVWLDATDNGLLANVIYLVRA